MFFPAPDESIWIGVLRLQILVPGARSLKDKRKAIQQIRERLKARGGLSVAEVGHLEDHTRAVLAVATVSNDARLLRSTLDTVAHEIESFGRGLVEHQEIAIQRPFDRGGAPTVDDEDEGGGWR